MKLGELKINCYKLIDPSEEEMLVENLERYESDSAYSYYFLNMLPSINSAITRVVQACILPLRRLEISCANEYNKTLKVVTNEDGSTSTVQTKKKAHIDLKEYTNDIYKIKLVEYEDKNENASNINYRIIGDYLDVTNQTDGNIVIYYFPRIPSLESVYSSMKYDFINDIDLNELGLDDNILSYIAYYVKADLLEADKPSEAVLARNTFEQYLASFEAPEIKINETHKSWWRGLL